MKEVQWSRLISVAIITSLLTCGLLIPIWLIVLPIVYLTNKPQPIPIPKMTTIYPGNDFASDWEFKIYEIETTKMED
jgi:hypothetical protein